SRGSFGAKAISSAGVLGGPCTVEGIQTHSHRHFYVQFPGKRREVTEHCTEATVCLREATPPRRTWEIVVRVYDDGAAFRYRFPPQNGWEKLVIAEEQTEFAVPPGARAFALPLNGFTTSYEKRYQVMPAGELPKNWLVGLPLLLESSGGVFTAITEANIQKDAGLHPS